MPWARNKLYFKLLRFCWVVTAAQTVLSWLGRASLWELGEKPPPGGASQSLSRVSGPRRTAWWAVRTSLRGENLRKTGVQEDCFLFFFLFFYFFWQGDGPVVLDYRYPFGKEVSFLLLPYSFKDHLTIWAYLYWWFWAEIEIPPKIGQGCRLRAFFCPSLSLAPSTAPRPAWVLCTLWRRTKEYSSVQLRFSLLLSSYIVLFCLVFIFSNIYRKTRYTSDHW